MSKHEPDNGWGWGKGLRPMRARAIPVWREGKVGDLEEYEKH